ncbi:PQQ-dependent catabolism-associated CXXCW motif protein [Ciceribacter azotifigens]|uniref:PQQ-dependent catabolism-associated CXXCW motif protein n=1 Tax=Ciceribacter azotifigens TaxID=2069303 RepID=UPI003A863889
MRMRELALAAATVLLPAMDAVAGPVPEPSGYRTENYRAEVPDTLNGARVVDTPEVVTLWKEHVAVFIDVLPHTPKPPELPAGTVWKDKVREDIPGSVWLANVGYGVLNEEMEAFFRTNLERLAGRNRQKVLLFYCQEKCWMSWNAARRAVEWGYRQVLWYPHGTDGWIAAGQPVEKAVPLQPEILRR